MSSLRRDLFERKLWPLVAALAAAVVLVPLVLLSGRSGGATPAGPPAPPVAAPRKETSGPAQTPATSVKVSRSRIARNPFSSGAPKLASTPTPQSTTSASSSTPTATTASSSTATPVAMVSPSPVTPSSSASSPTGAHATPSTTTSGAPATTQSTPSSPAAPANPAPATTQPSTPSAIPAVAHSWTIYSVAVRFGKDLSAPVQSNLLRLRPLPSVEQSDVMFMGVTAGGRHAVFELAEGVQHSGPGLCRPERAHCSAILLKAGDTENISVSTADGGLQRMVLRVIHITRAMTHSGQAALAAYNRHSAAGLCELALADPVSYSATDGTVSSMKSAACQHQLTAVPFRSLVPGW
jgi:hypothetical protein